MSPDSSATHRSSSASFSVFLAVALLSAAVLGFEIALSRVFATILRYQFAFLVVSLALCGLGLGGLWAHIKPRTSLENAALGWGVAVLVALAAILRGVFAFVPQHYWIAALIVLVPFGFAGAFLSLAFGRFKEQGGRLYAFDLAGAALAAALSVALMQALGAINACLFFAFLGAFASVLTTTKRTFSIIICALLLCAVPYNWRFGLWSVQPIPPVWQVSPEERDDARREERQAQPSNLAERGVTQPLFTEIGGQIEQTRTSKTPVARTQILDTRWNAFARTDVVLDAAEVAALVEARKHNSFAQPGSYLIYTNGNVPTNMIRWNGQVEFLPPLVADFPVSDWTFQNANLKNASVFSIGPGGGLDALLALRYGAKGFDGAEINPSIVALMNEPKYVKFNGGIYQRPEVRVRTADGRAAIREAEGQYRLVFSALTKTATAGQGAALLESFIYTREAFDDYLNALDADGAMAIVGDAPPLLARLSATAVDCFKRRGQNEREAGQHIAVVFDPQLRGPYGWVLLVKKTPFTPAQSAQMAASANARRLLPLWIPGQAANDTFLPFSFGSLLGGSLSLKAFIESGREISQRKPTPIDLSPCNDDRPFVLDLSLSPASLFASSPSLSWLLGLSLASTLGLCAFFGFGGSGTRLDARSPLLFLVLGVGFMFVEVPLIQKLVLPLGYPTLSLSVILFSILLGGGAGALFSQRFEGEDLRRHALLCSLGVVVLALAFGLTSDVWSRALLSLPLIVRCVVAGALLFPVGFALGTPFPSGLRLLTRNERDVALAWALNGTASVVGSVGAAVLAKVVGFSLVMGFGALVYMVAAGVFAISRREVD